MNDVILSILILTIPGREDKLKRITDLLQLQLPPDNSVELIITEEAAMADGGPNRGTRRNEALELVAAEYVAFIDDDDLVSSDYVEKILKALKDKPDVVGMKGLYCPNSRQPGPNDTYGTSSIIYNDQDIIIIGDKPQTFIHSIQYNEWKTVDGIHQRCPNHLNPVKLEIARKVKFPDMDHGEDEKYSMALREHLKTEAMIECPIYYYLK